ncbi:MAG: TIGR01777 family protein [Acidimicrobiia bacterium]|nr:TIGR01777 family protein [Acidimicrobiia bacterium]
MRIVIAGGTGFLGSTLDQELTRRGHTITVLTRRAPAAGQVQWTPNGTVGEWAKAIDGADAVVNLAGEPLDAGRWTAERKATIDLSRTHATRSLATAILQVSRRPAVFLSASAIGYYGPHDDQVLTEDAPAGTDFLATVCNQWEWEAQVVKQPTRVVLLRTGLVLDRAQGALPVMLPPFKLFAGGRMGSGTQYWSWIHIRDWLGIAIWALESEKAAGPVNLTAPHPVTNAEFARTLGRALHRPALFPAPAPILRLVLGEMADALLLGGQRVVPQQAQWGGYAFQYPRLEPALESLLH